MKAKINLITLWTDDVNRMKEFYQNIIGFEVINDLGDYIEFKNSGVRFAICNRNVMSLYDRDFSLRPEGQVVELAFECNSEEDLESTYQDFKKKDVEFIAPPKLMPWGQKTALFKDPDGNVHEIFTEIKKIGNR